jgi:hypothetical protein
MRGRVIRVDAVVGLRAPELGVAPCTSFHRCSAPPRTSGWLLGSGREQRLECLGLRVGPARGLRHRCPGIDVGRRSEVVSVPGGGVLVLVERPSRCPDCVHDDAALRPTLFLTASL